jgi:hypothetical protein
VLEAIILFRPIAGEFEAWFKGYEIYLGRGKTIKEAVGDLIVSNQGIFSRLISVREL